MDRLEAMAVFVRVVDRGSFSAASRELRMPLPTVSRRVSELETHVGTKLLVRSTRKLALTETGESYVRACRQILEDVTEADRVASGQYQAPRGELTLTAPVVFGRLHVVPIVTEFLKAHAEINVRLVLADRSLDLIDDHLDLALRVGTLPERHLVAIRIGQIRNVVCASPAYLEKHGTPRTPAQLASHDCITFAGLGNTEAWIFRDGETVSVRSRLTINTADAAIDAAIAGLGVARVLSYQVVKAVNDGQLVTLLKKCDPPPSPVHLIYWPELRLTGKVRAFIDFAVPKLRARALDSIR